MPLGAVELGISLMNAFLSLFFRYQIHEDDTQSLIFSIPAFLIDDNIWRIRSTDLISHFTPFPYSLRDEPDSSTAKAVSSPSIKGQEVTAFWIIGLKIFGLEAPSRAETIGHMPARTKLSAAVEPATVAQDALAHRKIYTICRTELDP